MLPQGCKDLLQAVEEFASGITEEDLEKMDAVVADRLQKHYPRIAELCFSSFEQLRPVRETITQEAKLFLMQFASSTTPDRPDLIDCNLCY